MDWKAAKSEANNEDGCPLRLAVPKMTSFGIRIRILCIPRHDYRGSTNQIVRGELIHNHIQCTIVGLGVEFKNIMITEAGEATKFEE